MNTQAILSNVKSINTKEQKDLASFLAKYNGNELLLQKAISELLSEELKAESLSVKDLAKKAFGILLPEVKESLTGYYYDALLQILSEKEISEHFEQANKNLYVLKKHKNFTEFKKEVLSDALEQKWIALSKNQKVLNTYHDPRKYLITKVIEKLVNSSGKKAVKPKDLTELFKEFTSKLENKIKANEDGFSPEMIVKELDALKERMILLSTSK